ncbi:Ig-like domain-containing protein [Lutibacter sp. TH_r2]|uniref:Ig-like domain-containing protein n=1 Tax=Lutibacter sp. TH_r2 TaxID=3082083 RepID=UPI002952CC74|nr:Ig-like domain-containing protein [Lutibacter sp. TH_r2]MDV7186246.1 Ig-like domain-containing protein [Lutibacter sp. TH_r2]
MKHIFFKIIVLLVISSLFMNCAKRGNPTGGPKDSIPPVLVKAIPKIESINFKAQKIKIEFNEYVKLKDVNKNLVISPPLKYTPEIIPTSTASKTISIKILDTLLSNTTYSFNFGNSIVDNNEGNELGNFKYVFSTGSYIDSLTISGDVTDPKMKKNPVEMDVMLYEYNENYTDSIIYKEKPRYLANTLDSTLFNLTNLKKGKYLMIALQDGNSNKIFDPRVDKIGFVKDTIYLPTDSTYSFTIFKEIPTLRVIKPKEVTKGHLIFGYEGDASSIDIKLLTETPDNFKSEIIFDKELDTIHYWYTPFEVDSLNFEVSKNNYFEALKARPRTKKVDSLKIDNSGSNLHLLDTFHLKSNTPIASFNKAYITLSKPKDSSIVNYEAFLSENKQKLFFNFEKENDTQYKLELLPEAVTDMFSMVSDSLNFSFKTKKPEDFGKLFLNFTGTYKNAIIVELLDKNEKLIRIQKLNEPKEITFLLLDPKTYFIRVTLDENKNGKWDTGNFLEKQQPEKIIYFKKELIIRANWELSESFILN